MKKLLSLILAVATAFSLCAVAFAEGETETFENRGFVLTLDGSEATIVGVTKDFVYSDIIEKANGQYDVVAIGPNAFANLGITGEIAIPETVRTIGENAFAGNNPREVTLYPNLENIGANAFKDCEIGKTYFMGTEKQFAHLNVGEGNEALFANTSYMSKQFVGEQMRNEALYNFGEAFLVAIGGIVLYPIYLPVSVLMPLVLPFSVIAPITGIINLFVVMGESFETFFGSFNV